MKKAGEQTINFGKYSGQRLASLPENYLVWMTTGLDSRWKDLAQEVLSERQSSSSSPNKFRPRVTFGKHKGEFLDTLPDQYLQWMTKEMTSPHWRQLAEDILCQRRGVVRKAESRLPDDDCGVEFFKDAIRNCKDLKGARGIYQMLQQGSLSGDRYLTNLAVEMFGKCGSVEEARRAFDGIAQPNVFSWNVMLKVYVRNGMGKEAEALFESMDRKTRSATSWNIALEAVAQQGDLEKTERFFARIEEKDVFSWTILLTAFVEKHRMDEAMRIFQELEEANAVTWNTMINGYARQGNLQQARGLFDQMPDRSSASWNIMISAYAEAGQVKEAKQIFDQATDKNQITWNAMLAAYAAAGHSVEARALFDEMPSKDEVTYACMLQAYQDDLEAAKAIFQRIPAASRTSIQRTILMQAYSKAGDVQGAKALFDQVPDIDLVATNAMVAAYAQNGHLQEAVSLFKRSSKKDMVTWNIMISAYGLSGCCDESKAIFDQMEERDVYSWTALITVYAQNDMPAEALGAYQQMMINGVRPNKVTFASLLAASDRLSQSLELFASMTESHGLVADIEHYNCMVRILGQESRLADAKELIENMPFVPDARLWMTFLAACKSVSKMSEGELKLAEHAAEEAFRLDPKASPFVLLAEIYSRAGKQAQVEKLKKRLKAAGVERLLGCSWVQVGSETHKLCVGEKPPPGIRAQILKLKKLMLERTGYAGPKGFHWDDKNVDYHSEKMALALALTTGGSSSSSIRIVNNLRTCDDCHRFLQLASGICGRRIILRDVQHVHHFEGGLCRCGDKW